MTKDITLAAKYKNENEALEFINYMRKNVNNIEAFNLLGLKAVIT